jgi:nucleoid-associated protein YgaU
MTGKAATKKQQPTCGNRKCGKVLYAPIRCDKCRQQFCPAHRFPNEHTCVTPGSAASSATTNLAVPSPAPHVVAGMAAIKRSLAARAAAARSAASKPAAAPAPAAAAKGKEKEKATSKSSNPFSSTDRYATLPRLSFVDRSPTL